MTGPIDGNIEYSCCCGFWHRVDAKAFFALYGKDKPCPQCKLPIVEQIVSLKKQSENISITGQK